MYGIDNRRAARGRSIQVLRPRRRLRPACEPLEPRALLANTNVPAWTGEWTMNGGASQPGGVTVGINFNDFYPHFLEFVGITFNSSYTGQLGLQGGATGSPAYSAVPIIPKTSNAKYGFDGELVGLVFAVAVPGSTTLPPVLGAFDFKLTDPGTPTVVPRKFTGGLTFTGADGSANTSVPLDMTFKDFGSTQGMTNPDQYAGFDNPWDLPPIAPYTYDIAPMVQNQSFTVTAGQPMSFNVLDGAKDPQGTTLSVQSVSSSAGGAPNFSQAGGLVTTPSDSSGMVTYDPPSNSNIKTDSFVYTAVNELGKTAVGTVTITIKLANNGGSGGDQGSGGDGLPPADNPADDARAKGALALAARIAELDGDVQKYSDIEITSLGADLGDRQKLGMLRSKERNLLKLANKLLEKGDPTDPAIQYARGLVTLARVKFGFDYAEAEDRLIHYNPPPDHPKPPKK
jgi:hypothetical protein